MPWTRLIPVSSCRIDAGIFVECEGRELAVFRLTGPDRMVVVDNACPHANGNLAGGPVENGVVTCPWHEWKFDLATGVCTHSDKARVRTYRCEVRDGYVWVNLEDGPEAVSPAPA